MKKALIIGVIIVVILLVAGFMFFSGDSPNTDSKSDSSTGNVEENPLETSEDVFSGIDVALNDID